MERNIHPARLKRFLLAVSCFFLLFAWTAIPFGEKEAPVTPAPVSEDFEGFDAMTQSQPNPNPNVPPPLSKRLVEYHILVKLNAEEKTLRGTQTLIWTHPGKKPINEIYLHLYPNAFRSDKTTFMRESKGKLRGDEMKEEGYGHMEIHQLTTVDGHNLLPQMKYVQPDDGNKHDMTLAKVRLPYYVEPGTKLKIQMDFSVKLPYVFARMGYAEDFVMAGQWFPKIAVYEPAGTRGRKEEGWNIHQYHGNSEFYSDFGIYNVQIQVPKSYTVAATGFPAKSPAVIGQTKMYHFYADDVHDFAWAASPHFVYFEEPFSTPHIPGVKLKLYLDPKHRHLKDRYFYTAKKALARFAEWYGPYPYTTLSIVVPPSGGRGAGGMEYPMLITAWEASDEQPGTELERVVVHEIGHQFWYGMVASNEFEEAWLDEGLTSYAEEQVMISEFGIEPNLLIESSYITSPAPLYLPSWEYKNHGHYADNVYTRAKLVLFDIEGQIGEKQMKKVLRTYFQRWKFKHPSTKDFQKTLEEVTGKSWGDYFRRYVYGGMMMDYAVESIRSKPVSLESGEKAYEHTIRLRNMPQSLRPVEVWILFSDGSMKKWTWNAKDTQIQHTFRHPSPIKWVLLDPEHHLVMENKRINNFLKADVPQTVQIQWQLGVVKFVEGLLSLAVW